MDACKIWRVFFIYKRGEYVMFSTVRCVLTMLVAVKGNRLLKKTNCGEDKLSKINSSNYFLCKEIMTSPASISR